MPSQQCIYAGFDATADSLHVGHLLLLSALLRFQRDGHRVIALIGDATAYIGDPAGQLFDRKVLEYEQIRQNVVSIREGIERIFRNYKKYFLKESSQEPTKNSLT